MFRETQGPAKLQVEKQVQCSKGPDGDRGRESWPHQVVVVEPPLPAAGRGCLTPSPQLPADFT